MRDDGRPSFSISFDILGYNVDPGFMVIQLDWVAVTPFNFTDGTSIPTISLLILMRTSMQTSNAVGVLAADLCALSFCAQKLNVSMSLNLLSSTVLQTVYGARKIHSKPERFSSPLDQEFFYTESDLEKGLSFTGDDFNMTFSELPDGAIDPTLWILNLRDLLSTFEGNLNGTSVPDWNIPPIATSNLISAFNASSNISMIMNNIAIAMTNYFRDSNNVTVIDQTGQIKFFVHVNWPWIIHPSRLPRSSEK